MIGCTQVERKTNTQRNKIKNAIPPTSEQEAADRENNEEIGVPPLSCSPATMRPICLMFSGACGLIAMTFGRAERAISSVTRGRRVSGANRNTSL
ncbi:unnamed protein product [Arctogadus glacialis]